MSAKVPAKIARRMKRIREWRDEVEDAKKDIDKYQEEVVEWMVENDEDKATIEVDGRELNTTLILGSSVTTDPDKLEALINDDKVWDSITVRVLDKKKLEKAVAQGKITPTTVAQASDVVEKKPYVRVTWGK